MFDRVVVVNLDRRPDRWQQFLERFPEDWPFAAPVRFPAIDGAACEVPEWYKAGPGAWGCLQSHVAIWWQMVEDKTDSVLVLEDDAVFCRDAVSIMTRTMEHTPADWDQIYFGGQHLDTNDRPPEVAVQDVLCRCRYVNRTHAYAIRQDFACVALDFIDCPNERQPRLQHIDYMLGDLHDSHEVYSPWRFCVGQSRGSSDVVSVRNRPKHVAEHWWNQFPIVEPAGVS